MVMTSSPIHERIRPPAVAGRFYPSDPRRLSGDVERLLSGATAARRMFHRRFPRPPLSFIVPHAGYMYSGGTAAEAYSLLRGSAVDLVVIVSPSHAEAFDGITIYPGTSYATPMGEVPVDEGMRARLAAGDPFIRVAEAGHRAEHAVEVHLPFLLSVLGPVPFLPVVMGDQRRQLCLHLARRLGDELRGRNVLMIASTDLSHYHPYAEAAAIDGRFVDLVGRFDPMAIMDGLETGSLEACGGGPAVAVMKAAALLGADRAIVLDHRNSGDTGGDRSTVVGYLSAVFFRPGHDEA